MLHDIDAERLAVARGTAEQVAQRFGRQPRSSPRLDRREALDGADFVVNMIQVGGIDATRVDLEVPARRACARRSVTPPASAACSAALRTFPVLSGIAADMPELCPDALVPELHQPDGDERLVALRRRAAAQGVGLCHSVYWTVHGLCELVGVPMEGTHFRAGGRQPPGLAHRVEPRRGRPLPAAARGHRGRPRARAARARGDLLSGRSYPTETSEHSSEYLSWFLRSDEQVRRFRLEPLRVRRDLRAERRRVRERPRRRSRGPAARAGGGRGEYAPQVIHSVLTGTVREIHVNVVNPGRPLIDNLPAGAVVEVPARRRRRRRPPDRLGSCRGRRGAQPRLPVGRPADRRGGPTGDPSSSPGRARRPERQSTLTPGRDLAALRRP